MSAFLVIVIAGLLLAMVGVLRNQLRELRADLERYKLAERLRQVINQPAGSAGGMQRFPSSSKNVA